MRRLGHLREKTLSQCRGGSAKWCVVVPVVGRFGAASARFEEAKRHAKPAHVELSTPAAALMSSPAARPPRLLPLRELDSLLGSLLAPDAAPLDDFDATSDAIRQLLRQKTISTASATRLSAANGALASLRASGNALFGKQQYRAAAQTYTDALYQCKDAVRDEDGRNTCAALLNNRAACYYYLRQYNASVLDASAALCIRPTYGKALVRRAEALFACGYGRQAAADFRAAILASPAPGTASQSECMCATSSLSSCNQHCSCSVGCLCVCTMCPEWLARHGALLPTKSAQAACAQLCSRGWNSPDSSTPLYSLSASFSRSPSLVSLPSDGGAQNEALRGASPLIAVSNDARSGRGLAVTDARASLALGAHLLHEDAFAAVLLPRFASARCDFCTCAFDATDRVAPLASEPYSVPCVRCFRAWFCSWQCAERAWTEYHCVECNAHGSAALDILAELPTPVRLGVRVFLRRLALESASTRLPWPLDSLASLVGPHHRDAPAASAHDPHHDESDCARVYAFIEGAASDASAALSADDDECRAAPAPWRGQGCGRDVASLWSHASHLRGVGSHLWLEYRMYSLVAAHVLIDPLLALFPPSATLSPGSAPSLPSAPAAAATDSAAALGRSLYLCILLHVCQTHTNTHAITALDARADAHAHTAGDSVTQVRVGAALYANASLMNHACRPSVSVSFVRGRQILVRAAAPLMGATALRHCYGPHVGRDSTRARRRMLADQYFFACDCDDCQDGGDSNVRLEYDELKCQRPACRGGALIIGSCSSHPVSSSLSSSLAPSCSECGAIVTAAEWTRLQQMAAAADALEARADACCAAAASTDTSTGSSIDSLRSSLTGAQQSHPERHSQSAWSDGRRALTECLRLRESALHALNRTLAATHDKLARAEAAMGTVRWLQRLAFPSMAACMTLIDPVSVAHEEALVFCGFLYVCVLQSVFSSSRFACQGGRTRGHRHRCARTRCVARIGASTARVGGKGRIVNVCARRSERRGIAAKLFDRTCARTRQTRPPLLARR